MSSDAPRRGFVRRTGRRLLYGTYGTIALGFFLRLPAIEDLPESLISPRVTVDGWVRAARCGMLGAQLLYKYKWVLKDEDSEWQWSRMHLEAARRICAVCELNGGLYVKVGQSMAAMNNLLPLEYTRTLAKLQDTVYCRPISEVFAIIYRDFDGQSVEDLFSSFDKRPLAAASLAQVHEATIKQTGERVAVKVQYLDVAHRLRGDMAVIALWFKLSAFFFPGWDWSEMMRQTEDILEGELHFEEEGTNGEKCRVDLENRFGSIVTTPKVYWSHTRKRVLTCEFVDGVKVNDRRRLRLLGIDPAEVAKMYVSVFAYQLFCTGFLHCDPHPGNVFVRVHPEYNAKRMLKRNPQGKEEVGDQEAGDTRYLTMGDRVTLSGNRVVEKNKTAVTTIQGFPSYYADGFPTVEKEHEGKLRHGDELRKHLAEQDRLLEERVGEEAQQTQQQNEQSMSVEANKKSKPQAPPKLNTPFQLVVLDHGLYTTIPAKERLALAGAWTAAAWKNDFDLKKYTAALQLPVDEYDLFASLLLEYPYRLYSLTGGLSLMVKLMWRAKEKAKAKDAEARRYTPTVLQERRSTATGSSRDALTASPAPEAPPNSTVGTVISVNSVKGNGSSGTPNPLLSAGEETTMLQEFFTEEMDNINRLSNMLSVALNFAFVNIDIVRSVNKELGYPVNRTALMLRYSMEALHREGLTDGQLLSQSHNPQPGGSGAGWISSMWHWWKYRCSLWQLDGHLLLYRLIMQWAGCWYGEDVVADVAMSSA